MNILSLLFGIFRQRGLVETLQEGRKVTSFAVSAIILSIVGGALYGFAMGIGLGIETAIKDAVKVGLIASLGLLFSIPIFWVAYRLLGRQERLSHVASVPLTLVATVSIILTVTAPIVFMLSIMAGYSPEAVYIHVVIVDLALLVGLYLAGTLIYHGFPERKGLVIPNVIGFVMMVVILVVLMGFLGPFLSLSSTFSVGTDRLKDGLGIGVEETVNRSLTAAAAADRVAYRFQTTNENGDVSRDYQVTLVGEDLLAEVKLHAVAGETSYSDVRVWRLDGAYYTDMQEGMVMHIPAAQAEALIAPALPEDAFALPADLTEASWRAYRSGNHYIATGTAPNQIQAQLVTENATGRLVELTLGSTERGVHSQRRVMDLQPASLERTALEASLNQAAVLSSVDRSDASMQDYAQADTFFVIRYPRTWSARTWSTPQRRIEFTTRDSLEQGGATLTVSVYDLAEDKGAQQYADDLAGSLELQAEYRQITAGTSTFGGQMVGVVEYLHDELVKGEVETTAHLEIIFVGQLNRYHLDFAAHPEPAERHRDLFEAMAEQFTYLRADLWRAPG